MFLLLKLYHDHSEALLLFKKYQNFDLQARKFYEKKHKSIIFTVHLVKQQTSNLIPQAL